MIYEFGSDFLLACSIGKLPEIKDISVSSTFQQITSVFYDSENVFRQLPPPPPPQPKRVLHCTKKGEVQGTTETLYTDCCGMFQGVQKVKPCGKVGKSRFAAIRPPHVLRVTSQAHIVCVCPCRENFEMFLRGMRKLIPQIPSSKGLLKLTVCKEQSPECYLGDCTVCTDAIQRTETLLLFL